MDLNLDAILRDRRVAIALAGGALAFVAVLGILVGLLTHGHKPASAEDGQPPAPKSLQVEIGKDDPGLDPSRPLRCFVGGRFVGMVTLKECAEQNGVSAGALDVGLDPSGDIAAATSDASVLQPLPSAPQPPPPGEAAPAAAPAPAPAAPALPVQTAERRQLGACWRYAGDWRKIADAMSLDACVQALYAGQCERPGDADYGRWDGDTLRLVTGRVERSSDNRTFRSLVKQAPGECAIPHLAE